MRYETETGVEFRQMLSRYLAGLIERRDYAGAVKCYEDHRDMIASAGGAWAGGILHHAAKAYACLIDYPNALKAARTAQSLVSQVGDTSQLADLFVTLGGILRDMGEIKEAERAFRDAESIFRRQDDLEGQSRALNLLAGLFYRRGDFRNALAVLLEALAIAQHLGDRTKVAYMMGNVGRIYTFIGDLREARKHLEINLELSSQLQDFKERTRARIALGYVSLLEHDFAEAGRILHEAHVETVSLGLKRDEVICLTYIGELQYNCGDYDLAKNTLDRARTLAEQYAPEAGLVGRVLRHLAELSRRTDRLRPAAKYAAQANVIIQKVDDRIEAGALDRIKAQLAEAAGQIDEARRLFAQSLTTLDDAGVKLEKAETLLASGQSSLYEPQQRFNFLFQAEEIYSRHRLDRRLRQVEKLVASLGPGVISSGMGQSTDSQTDQVDFITTCPEIVQFKRQIAAIGQTDLPLLLTGETGVGKDHLARYYHSVVRPHGPYVAINCASLPETLLESELFGFERGAFTGADRSKPGLMVAADGGVLLLDEIGDMPLNLQSKLLGVLERRRVIPLGSTREISFDIKLIAATNQNLEAMVECGRFRRDLYFRLSGITLTIPPLRERKGDVPLLMNSFMRECALLGAHEKLPTELVSRFVAYHWPGNVRELRNKIRRLQIMRDLVAGGDLTELSRTLFAEQESEEQRTLFDRVEQFEKQLLVEAMLAAAGNKSEAARLLGIHEATVRTKLKRYGIVLDGGGVC